MLRRALLVLLVACGATARTDKQRGNKTLILPRGGAPAPWFDDVIYSSEPTPPSAYRLADGISAGLISLSEEGPPWLVFVLHEQLGLIGRVAVPAEDVVWLGLGRDDEVLAARADGTLLAAPIDQATRSDAFVERAVLAGASSWDAAGPTIAGTNGTSIWISLNGGATFRKSVLKDQHGFRVVLARFDGAV